MKAYQIKLKNYSGTLTPFHADTIFGHLCWVVAHREGDEGLQEFLKPFKAGNPPFVISDGFPDNFLPKPLSVEFSIDDPDERKELRKIDLIADEDFYLVQKGERFKLQPLDTYVKTSLTTHNSISRLNNTTLSEGGVYSLEETYVPTITVYIKVVSEEWKNRVIELLNDLSKGGYGRKKSIGKGQFFIEDIKEFKSFVGFKNANGFVSLSNFCPEENDPTEGFYKTFVKYGKLGEEFTFCGNPFKKPLVMIKTGSVFKTNGPLKEFYGRLIEEVAPAKPEVVQYGYAFAVPMIVKPLLSP